jgi:putative ABC transport system permease protein
MSNWLDSFAFRIDMNSLTFFAGGLVALIIALLTISYHTLKASVANPIDSLRDK